MPFERVDLFTMVHKGIRAMLYDAGTRLQATDFTNADARESMFRRIEHDIDLMDEHARHEDELIFPAIARFEPGTLQVLDAEHMEIYRCSEAIRTTIRDARLPGDADAQLAGGVLLTRSFNEFLAMQSLHMNHEEATASPALWRHYSDHDLTEMRGAITAKQSPERAAEWMRWMLTSCSDPELASQLKGVAANAPAPARDRIFSLAEAVLGKERWTRVRQRAGV